MKNTYKSILQEMSERTLKSDTLEGDAQLFALLRQTACASGDLPAMADVDNAVLMAVEKCRAERGDDAAYRLWTLYEYSNAGATLGCDFATAMSNGDTSFGEATERAAGGKTRVARCFRCIVPPVLRRVVGFQSFKQAV